MADDGGGGGGGEGGGNPECVPMEELVERILSNSQALAEALAADRARRDAADRIQRESWEAALKGKDAEIERLRAEAADAKKKLQADASRKMGWEAAHELLLGANQKLAELRNADMEDSRTCAEPPNSKDTVDHIASDLSEELRKLKQAYNTLGSKKDEEVSALLSEKDSVCNQLDKMQQDYAELLKNKKAEASQATEAALKLQKSVDELKVLAQKKDYETGRLQTETIGKDWQDEPSLKRRRVSSKSNDAFIRDARMSAPSFGKKTVSAIAREVKKLSWFERNSLCMMIDTHRDNYRAYCEHMDILHTQREILHKISGEQGSLPKKTRPIAYESWNSSRVPWSELEQLLTNRPRGVPRPHEQLPSASPSASASAAAGLIKLKKAEQQQTRAQRLPGQRGRGGPWLG